MSDALKDALRWTAAALQEVFRTNPNVSEFDRIVIDGSSATAREILNRADAALAPAAQGAEPGTRKLLMDARHRIANLSRAAVPFDDPLDGPVLRRLDAAIASAPQQPDTGTKEKLE